MPYLEGSNYFQINDAELGRGAEWKPEYKAGTVIRLLLSDLRLQPTFFVTSGILLYTEVSSNY